MKNCAGQARAFSLVELAIAMVVLSLLMLAAYQLVNQGTRNVTTTLKKARLSETAGTLRQKLDKIMRNIGYNPKLVPYPTYTCNPAPNPPDLHCRANPLAYRIGVTLLKISEIGFTSDDNESGAINSGESYGLWIEDPAIPNVKVDLSAILERNAEEGCTTKPGMTFTTTYTLFSQIPIAYNLKCFEVRYFASGVSDWRFQPPLPPTSPERPYYEYLRDQVAKVQLTILLANPGGNDERIVVDSRLNNLPWVAYAVSGPLPFIY